MLAWTEKSDVKLKFLEIFQKVDVFYVTYITHTLSPLFTGIPFTGVKRTFPYFVL